MKSWIVVCISDTHQRHRQLTDRLKSSHQGDILIHAGDMTNFSRGTKPFEDFDQWLNELSFKEKFIIGGNHESITNLSIENGQTLNNKEILIDDCLRIYGSSWRSVGESSWLDIPLNSHIVVTHNPPISKTHSHCDLEIQLQMRLNQIKPLLSVFGHIHQDYGVVKHSNGILFANAASLSQSRVLNDPLRFRISIDQNSVASIEQLF